MIYANYSKNTIIINCSFSQYVCYILNTLILTEHYSKKPNFPLKITPRYFTTTLISIMRPTIFEQKSGNFGQIWSGKSWKNQGI